MIERIAEKPTEANPFVAALVQEAKDAGLRYSSDTQPGIQRVFRRGKPVYMDANGKAVSDQNTLVRIKRLAIPPAWTDVWICPKDNGHIQAVGRDAKGRKQYRYHDNWRKQRDENKFGRMMEFARALPQIRKRVKAFLRRPGMPREKVLATVVALLETTLIRVGNDEYARKNKSYGLTTMRNKHARVTGETIRFAFRGKSGKHHEISVRDPQLARIIRKCQDLPGQDLFGYVDADGTPRDVTSQDVNDFLREITGSDFTAKDFRTWSGTVLAAIALREFEHCEHKKQAKKNITQAIEAVAKMLGNTPAVCRKCYVHPEILESYLAGQTIATIEQRIAAKDSELKKLRAEEAAVLKLLKVRLQSAKRGNR
jgi:DNA topoisomerase I